jgi:CRP/FNR family transcriptional regulator, cyclic AMP receptor protein
MNNLAEGVVEQPLILRLDPQHREEILECAHEVHADAGTFLLREGASANHFYIITAGKVALEVHEPGTGTIIIETLGPGEVLGWSWLFAPYRWHFDVRVLDDFQAVAFDGRCIRGKCEADPALGYRLMEQFAKVMMERLQATRFRLMDLYGTSAVHGM